MADLDELLTTLQLRVLVASRAVLPANWSVVPHVLPCNKIYYPYRGVGGYSVDGVKVHFKPQHVYLLPAKHVNDLLWLEPKNPIEKIWIHFDARVLGLVDLFDVIPLPAPFSLAGDHETVALIEKIVAEDGAREPAPFRALTLQGLLALALSRILRHAAENGAPKQSKKVVLRGQGDRIGDVLQYIAGHFSEPLTLDDLAKVAHLHPTYFSNTFRKATGVAPMTFLQRFRIERAKGLLASGDLPVMEVAARSGFPDPYHFSRVFKKLAGSPPTVFQDSVRRTSPH